MFSAIVFVLAQVFLKIDQRAEMKPEKTWVFCTPKLWQILKHFIKHKPLIYEDCILRLSVSVFNPKRPQSFLKSSRRKINEDTPRKTTAYLDYNQRIYVFN